MPRPSTPLVFVVALLISMLKQGTPILSCYLCTLCDDPFQVTPSMSTSSECTACTKTISPAGSVSRSCSFSRKPYSGCQTLAQHQTGTTTCYCDNTNNCNTGTRHDSAVLLLVTGLLVGRTFV